jgi:hypothetical protein
MGKEGANDRTHPRISIVTPSFNQAEFLNDTIRSVLCQEYPNLDYIVIDGGSTDGSAALIRQYNEQLSYWVSEQDGGQYDGINKGFARSSGEIMAWINSDDLYFPWTLSVVAEIFTSVPEIQWLTSIAFAYWDQRGRAVTIRLGEGYNRDAFFRGRNAGLSSFHTQYIQQEATFWRRELWEAAGGYVDADLQLAGDLELWTRFWQHSELYSTTALLGGFRRHGRQKTASKLCLYKRETEQTLRATTGRIPGRLEAKFLQALRLFPHLRRLVGWQTKIVEYDHPSGRWFTRRGRFV